MLGFGVFRIVIVVIFGGGGRFGRALRQGATPIGTITVISVVVRCEHGLNLGHAVTGVFLVIDLLLLLLLLIVAQFRLDTEWFRDDFPFGR